MTDSNEPDFLALMAETFEANVQTGRKTAQLLHQVAEAHRGFESEHLREVIAFDDKEFLASIGVGVHVDETLFRRACDVGDAQYVLLTGHQIRRSLQHFIFFLEDLGRSDAPVDDFCRRLIDRIYQLFHRVPKSKGE